MEFRGEGYGVLRKKAIKPISSRGTTVPVSVRLKTDIRENLTLLIATRKTTNKAARKPASVAAILDDAVSALAAKLEGASEVAFIPVPPNDCVRLSLRINIKTLQAAQKWAREADVRVADFIRTALTLYLRKYAGETARYARPNKR
jgi:hypothetical protein